MPTGRRSGGKVKGGGFGNFLKSRVFTKEPSNYSKPNISRILGQHQPSVNVTNFIDRDAAASHVETNDLYDYFSMGLLQKSQPVVLKNRDGSLFDISRACIVSQGPAPIEASKTLMLSSYDLPYRPVQFKEPGKRVLDCIVCIAQCIQYITDHNLAQELSDTNYQDFLQIDFKDLRELSQQEACEIFSLCCDSRFLFWGLWIYFNSHPNAAPLLSSHMIEHLEARAFATWREQLNIIHQSGDVITPYEKNLSYWKQLWRTVERSDIIFQIVDARNPLLFRSEALQNLIKSNGKTAILLINKSDHLSPAQRKIWQQYFNVNNTAECWLYSSMRELLKDRFVETSNLTRGFLLSHNAQLIGKQTFESTSMSETSCHTYSSDFEIPEQINSERRLRGRAKILKKRETSDKEHFISIEATKDWVGVLSAQDLLVKLESIGEEVLELRHQRYALAAKMHKLLVSKLIDYSTEQLETFWDTLRQQLIAKLQLFKIDDTTKKSFHSASDFVTSLLGPLSTLEYDDDEHGGARVVVGTTGFPNVGKSSLINSLIRNTKYRVSVSRTPGKTRHLQTVDIPQSCLRLCDCPGLVMPTSAASREDLVIHGILNSDTYQGSMLEPMKSLLIRVSKQIGHLYGVTIDHLITADMEKVGDILDILATKRGYFSCGRGGVPDRERFARELAKQFLDGKVISFCEIAPNADSEWWLEEENIKWGVRATLVKQRD